MTSRPWWLTSFGNAFPNAPARPSPDRASFITSGVMVPIAFRCAYASRPWRTFSRMNAIGIRSRRERASLVQVTAGSSNRRPVGW